jgi:hypothetical protein
MDIQSIVAELRQEAGRIEQAIGALVVKHPAAFSVWPKQRLKLKRPRIDYRQAPGSFSVIRASEQPTWDRLPCVA